MSTTNPLSRLQADVRHTWETKQPARDEPEPPRPPRRKSSVQKLHNASGFPDLLVDGREARVFRDRESYVSELPSGLAPYERPGVPFGEDDEG